VALNAEGGENLQISTEIAVCFRNGTRQLLRIIENHMQVCTFLG